MPHLKLERSSNVVLPDDVTGLLQELHTAVADIGGIRIGNCKSRVYVADDYLIGSGGDQGGFVHLDVRFLEGRSAEARQAIGKALLELLVQSITPINGAVDLHISVEVRDIARAEYFKYPEGTLTPVPE